jgi:CPA2 family monovalent cation:H+ antiporter-2
MIAIAMLTLLASIAQFGGANAVSVLPTLGKLGAFVVFLVFLSLLIVPKLLSRLTRETHPEVRTVVVGGILLTLSWLAVEVGYSLALGAFVFGAIVGSTRFKSDIEGVFEGLRQVFGAVFFVAVGVMVDFKLLAGVWPLAVGVGLLALVLRPLACALGLVAVGNSTRESVQAALAVTPLGEFTFVIAQLGFRPARCLRALFRCCRRGAANCFHGPRADAQLGSDQHEASSFGAAGRQPVDCLYQDL